MKKKFKKKTNRSYESEPSSSGASSASDGGEQRSFDENLPLIAKQHYSKNKKIIDAVDQNEVFILKPNRKINEKSVFSSQESDFYGFSNGKIEDNSSFLDETKEDETSGIYDTTATNDECEENDDIESEIKNGSKYKKDFIPIPEESSQQSNSTSLKFKISAKSVSETGVTIYEMISVEDSCNAVDMKLSTENETFESSLDESKDLSFNGRINSILVGNEISEHSDDINVKNNHLENVSIENIDDIKSLHISANLPSPDLFEDDSQENLPKPIEKTNFDVNNFKDFLNDSQDDNNFYNSVKKRENELLKRIQNSLSGIPPPPSKTIIQNDLFKAIVNNKENIFKFFDDIKNLSDDNNTECLFKPTHDFEELDEINWPSILKVNHHGICYNASNISEKIELLNMTVAERYIGSETASSCQLSPSSTKKRNMRLKQLTQSPGSRLSHLAKRRAIFSSANLQSNSQKLTVNTVTNNRQILLNSNKTSSYRKKIATINRKSPGSKKKNVARKTPSSSAKKRFTIRLELQKLGPTRETSKRALFQSPPQQQQTIKATVINTKPLFKPEVAIRVEKSKRALFSPEKMDFGLSQSNLSQSQSSLFGSFENLSKRKRIETPTSENSRKIMRYDSIISNPLTAENLTPRSLKIKSQSFCGGASEKTYLDSFTTPTTVNGKPLFRASSDTTFCSSQLTESHRKKLLWAVSQALQKKQIGTTHPDFKKYASVLAKAIKRLFLEYYKKSNSTSDTMLRLSKKYVYSVTNGKTADDVYLLEKNFIESEKKMLSSKISGYIAPGEYENMKNNNPFKISNSFMSFENTMDSCSNQSIYSQSTQNSLATTITKSQGQENHIINNNNNSSNNTSAMKLPIQPNQSLQNSSSKNNLNGLALRENVDCELRKSTQKNYFTGKDQRNVSPYTDRIRSVNSIKSTNVSFDINTVKVKRQISFDN